MGAWFHMDQSFWRVLRERFEWSGVYRDRSASPATGSAASHRKEQEMLINAAFER